MKPGPIKILCVETNEIFNRRVDILKKYPKAFQVSKVLNGERHTAGGFHWIYIEFDEN
jgi:hypothetical protein